MNWRALKPNRLVIEGLFLNWPQFLLAFLGRDEIPRIVYIIYFSLWLLTFVQWNKRIFKFNQTYFNYISLLVPAFIFFEFKTFLGRDAASSFLLLLTALKAFEFKPERDRFFTSALNIAAVSLGFLFDISFSSSVLVILGLLSCLFALLNKSLLKEIFAKQLAYVLSTVVLAIPLSVFLFFFFPRFGFKMSLGSGTIGKAAMTGFSDEIRPGSLEQMIQSDEIVFRVTPNTFIPETERYWRGVVLEVPDDLTWNRQTANFNSKLFSELAKYDYTINLEPQSHNWLFVLDHTDDLGLTSPTPLIYGNTQFRRTTSFDEPITYQGHVATTALPADVQNPLYYVVENQYKKGRVADWISKLPQKIPTKEKIKYLESYLQKENFTYSLQNENLIVSDLNDFLFNKKTGYCEHYASAMAHVLRIWGVGSRVVAGFLGGEENTLGDYITVRGRNAHAWVEYIDETGHWQRWDPTAAVSKELASAFGLVQRSGNVWKILLAQTMALGDYVNYEWSHFFLAYDRQEQMRRLSDLSFPPIYYLVFAFLITIIGTGIVVFLLRKRNIVSIQSVYLDFVTYLQRKKIINTLGLTPLELSQALKNNFVDMQGQIEDAFSYYQTIYQRNGHVSADKLEKKLKTLQRQLK